MMFSHVEADELLRLVKQCRATTRTFDDAVGDLPGKVKAAADADDAAFAAVVDWVYDRTK